MRKEKRLVSFLHSEKAIWHKYAKGGHASQDLASSSNFNGFAGAFQFERMVTDQTI